MREEVYFCPSTNVLGLAFGGFIQFEWNGKLEESYLPVLRDEGYWVYIGDFD